MLSHAVWASRFGADSGVLGRTLVLNGLPHQVIGVTAADFQDPFGPTEIWLPATSGPNPNWVTRANPAFGGVGRIRAGVSEAEAPPTWRGSPGSSPPSIRRPMPASGSSSNRCAIFWWGTSAQGSSSCSGSWR